MEKESDVLERCALFAGIQSGELEALLGCIGVCRKRFYKGESILSQGDPAGRFGILLRGRVHIIREDHDGTRSVIAHIKPSELFAEAYALAKPAHMPVGVIAEAESDVMLVDASRIVRTCCAACAFHQRLIYNMMKILAVRNMTCSQKLEIMGKRSTRDKLLAYLDVQASAAESSTFLIPFDRQQLADYLGVNRSGLSCEIGKLQREGLISCEKNRFTLHRAPALSGW